MLGARHEANHKKSELLGLKLDLKLENVLLEPFCSILCSRDKLHLRLVRGLIYPTDVTCQLLITCEQTIGY